VTPELKALLIRAADKLDSLPGGHQDISDDLRFEAEQVADVLRDEFAKAALIGLLANPELLQAVTRREIKDGTADVTVALYSYRYVDAMLAARNK